MTRTIALIAALLAVSVALGQGPRFGDAPRSGMEAREQTQRLTGQQAPSALAASMRGALHDVVDLSEDEVHARKEAGASLATIAADHGIGRAALEAAFLARRGEAIAALLEAGRIDPARAERMVARGAEVAAAVLDRAGIAGGVHAEGEPLRAQRSEAPRGPNAGAPVRAHRMEPVQRGPHGQREP